MVLPIFGSKDLENIGFPTPEDVPEVMGCRCFSIPSSTAWFAVVMGCLMLLTDEDNWQQFSGGITREAAAAVAELILNSGYEESCGVGGIGVPTPFWDDATDLDDEETPETQTWYGEVDDVEAEAAGLTFIENAAIWVFTGFIAYSGDIGAAIVFHTIAPSFILAWRAGDIGEIFRIVVDAADYGTVDTSGIAGEVVRVPIMTDPTLTGHDIMLIKVS